LFPVFVRFFKGLLVRSQRFLQGGQMKTIGSIGAGARLCAVIGNPIAHSLSPAIHNAAYEELGLDYVYMAFRVEDVQSALAGMRALENFRGMSVTIPHKIEAMKYVDRLDEVDRAIGSINTVVNDDGNLRGFGTDGPGALKALTDAGVNIDEKNVLFLGAGGAARMIAFTLANQAKPGVIQLMDIDKNILESLQSDLTQGANAQVQSGVFDESSMKKAMGKADVVIHCTPVGMHPKEDASLIPPELFRPEQAVFDIVYTPLETRLLKEARLKGCKVVAGVEMFVNQAVLQFEEFTGADAPVEVMRRKVLERLQS
jgi:shikimate dehydrogenase